MNLGIRPKRITILGFVSDEERVQILD